MLLSIIFENKKLNLIEKQFMIVRDITFMIFFLERKATKRTSERFALLASVISARTKLGGATAACGRPAPTKRLQIPLTQYTWMQAFITYHAS